MLRKPLLPLPLSDVIFIGSSQLSAADVPDRPTVEVSLTDDGVHYTHRFAFHVCIDKVVGCITVLSSSSSSSSSIVCAVKASQVSNTNSW